MTVAQRAVFRILLAATRTMLPMPALLTAHLAAVCLYAGFQWTVQVVVYPQFAGVDTAGFAAYERAHQRRISYLVGPLFAALLITSTAMVVAPPAGVDRAAAVVSAGLVGVILVLTGAFAVPLHRRLDVGWDAQAHRSLMRVDALRVAAATVNVMLVVVLAAR